MFGAGDFDEFFFLWIKPVFLPHRFPPYLITYEPASLPKDGADSS